jgi:GTP diphosphokinase / guanosine-3',5'-bis(diphosphate) 3'-diphosphatase
MEPAAQFNNLEHQEKQFLSLLKTFPHTEQERITHAYTLAKQAHAGQFRDEGEPYVTHPIRIARTLVEQLNERRPDVIIAALLHDTVEDTELTQADIEKYFGVGVAKLVAALTRPKEQPRAESYAKLLHADVDVRLIKACDCLDNMRSMRGRIDVGSDRWLRHHREAEEYYLPLGRSVASTALVKEMQSAFALNQEVNHIRKSGSAELKRSVK